MSTPPTAIDLKMMRTGLRRTAVRSRGPLLCVLKAGSIRLIGMSGMRMMIAWEHPLAGPSSPQFYVLPTLVTHLLISPLGQELAHIALSTSGKDAVLSMDDTRNQHELRWRTDLRQFMTPPEFTHMLAIPQVMIPLSYLNLSDAAHQAVANLANMQSTRNIPSEKLAVLVEFGAGLLTFAGRAIGRGTRGAYYFDPRLLIRALEIIKSQTLRVGMTPLPVGHRAVLTLTADQEGGRVHCALLSIGMDTQKLYPLPPERLAAM
jgi:hypothetical protein